MLYLMLPFYHFFTFNISIIKFCYFRFFHLVFKQSVERTQSNQTVKEVRNKVEAFRSHIWMARCRARSAYPTRSLCANEFWRQVKLNLDWSAMNQKWVKLQMVKHYQVIESDLERESLVVILYHYNFSWEFR